MSRLFRDPLAIKASISELELKYNYLRDDLFFRDVGLLVGIEVQPFNIVISIPESLRDLPPIERAAAARRLCSDPWNTFLFLSQYTTCPFPGVPFVIFVPGPWGDVLPGYEDYEQLCLRPRSKYFAAAMLPVDGDVIAVIKNSTSASPLISYPKIPTCFRFNVPAICDCISHVIDDNYIIFMQRAKFKNYFSVPDPREIVTYPDAGHLFHAAMIGDPALFIRAIIFAILDVSGLAIMEYDKRSDDTAFLTDGQLHTSNEYLEVIGFCMNLRLDESELNALKALRDCCYKRVPGIIRLINNLSPMVISSADNLRVRARLVAQTSVL
jgi:hypothetical protein